MTGALDGRLTWGSSDRNAPARRLVGVVFASGDERYAVVTPASPGERGVDGSDRQRRGEIRRRASRTARRHQAFPGVLANDNVSLTVKPGEIHALLGENGAGKSTLVKMIYGILAPDAGEMLWNGEPVKIAEPARRPQARHRHGVPAFLAVRGADRAREHRARARFQSLATRPRGRNPPRARSSTGCKLDPKRIVSTLSVGERQRIEIVRALLLNPSLLIMDEPTSVLTPQEVEQLFETLRKLAAGGCSILYISHKLHEIIALCDIATILRGGKVVAECDPKKETSKSMAELMIGANSEGDRAPGAVARSARRNSPREGSRLPKHGDFGVDAAGHQLLACAPGEILGVAGVAGNGQNELMEALSGEMLGRQRRSDPDGGRRDRAARARPSGARSASAPCRRSATATPRSATSRSPRMAALTARRRMGFMQGGLISASRAAAYADKVIKAFAVKALGPRSTAGSLSGGNLQKFIMGREILQEPIGARRQPADLGRRRRRGGARSARRSSTSPGAAARWSSSRRTSTNCWNSAIRWSSSISGSLSRVMKVGEVVDRGDRPVDGRRSRRSGSDGADDGGPACASDLRSAREPSQLMQAVTPGRRRAADDGRSAR